MVVPMRLAATMRLKLVGVGGADAAEAMCATSSCAVGTGRYAHTVGTRNSWAHVAAHHSSGVSYAEAPHVRVLLSAEPVAAPTAWAAGLFHAAGLRSRAQSVRGSLDLAPRRRAPGGGGTPGTGAVPPAR